MATWKVKKELGHGGLIHGARRAKDDVFEAPETAMTFLALEGVVERVTTTTPAAKPAAPDAAKTGA